MKRFSSFFGAVLVVAVLCALPAGAAEKAADWRSVSRVRGVLSIDWQEWIREGHFSDQRTFEQREEARVQFVMERDRGDKVALPPGLPPELAALFKDAVENSKMDQPQASWRAISATISGSRQAESSVVPYGSSSLSASFRGAPQSLKDFTLSVDFETGAWQIVSPGKLRDPYPVVVVHQGDDPRTDTSMDDVAQSATFDGVVSGPPVMTTATYQDAGAVDQKPTRGFRKSARLQFWPEFNDVEVEVTIDDYAKWRPQGSIPDSARPGNRLIARGTLRPKGAGRVEDLPRVKAFHFALLDTSREPGVCLNWPMGAKDSDFDMRLAAAPPFAGQVGDGGQRNDVAGSVKDERGRPYAESAIDSYDFGGRSSLQVVCELADGREIVGVMKTDAGDQDLVRLPKMNGPDWIAEVWRKEKNVPALAANADDEVVAGQKDNGDGFTLYEEYRGWVVSGQHVEGDRERKDFFVLNLIGGEAQPGIGLFETLSELRVHSRLRRGEMAETTRLMNGNHRDAPHRVNQHGVWVKTFTRATLGDTGADTPMTKSGVAGRPGITKGVGILARSDPESAFNKAYNLPAQDAMFAYDRAIAHELLHSVGVEHHGPSDSTGYSLIFIPPNVPKNKIGRPHYQSGDGTVFTLLTEDGHDLAAATYVSYAETMGRYRAAMMDMLVALWSHGPAGSTDPVVARQRAEDSLAGAFDQVYEQSGMVGLPRGAHSGNQDCVMRYYFARFYPALGRRDTLYLVTPGTERIGLELCRAAPGTGVNAASHRPQSRYSNAASGAGNCFSQICPNDAIAPRKAVSP